MSPSKDQRPSTLLALPAELRREIFRLALTSPECQRFHRELPIVDVVIGGHGSAYWGTRLMSSLLRVNKQVHGEAEEILYAQSIFRFAPRLELSHLKTWLGRLSDRAKKDLIQNVMPTFNLEYYNKVDRLCTMEGKVAAARERFELLATELSKLRMAVVEVSIQGQTLRMFCHDDVGTWILRSTEALKSRGLKLEFRGNSAENSGAERIFKLCRERMVA